MKKYVQDFEGFLNEGMLDNLLSKGKEVISNVASTFSKEEEEDYELPDASEIKNKVNTSLDHKYDKLYKDVVIGIKKSVSKGHGEFSVKFPKTDIALYNQYDKICTELKKKGYSCIIYRNGREDFFEFNVSWKY